MNCNIQNTWEAKANSILYSRFQLIIYFYCRKLESEQPITKDTKMSSVSVLPVTFFLTKLMPWVPASKSMNSSCLFGGIYRDKWNCLGLLFIRRPGTWISSSLEVLVYLSGMYRKYHLYYIFGMYRKLSNYPSCVETMLHIH